MTSLYIALAFMFVLYWQNNLLQGPVCVRCGGKRKHADDCPHKDD